jgi:SAM-dependent methyltransferase
MNHQPSWVNPEFDQFADEYERALERGISVSGETMDFFARGRVSWLARCLTNLAFQPMHILDFGCGTGGATSFLLRLPYVRSVCGVDVSPRSLVRARKLHNPDRTKFLLCEEMTLDGSKDLAFSNGVFHHIPVDERAGAVAFVWRTLRPGGLFALWENNPWNPGTRYVMSRIPFDRDAITLSGLEASRLLQSGGFEVLRTDFLFVFPHALRWFRGLEPALSRLPLGAQYQVLARKV